MRELSPPRRDCPSLSISVAAVCASYPRLSPLRSRWMLGPVIGAEVSKGHPPVEGPNSMQWSKLLSAPVYLHEAVECFVPGERRVLLQHLGDPLGQIDGNSPSARHPPRFRHRLLQLLF